MKRGATLLNGKNADRVYPCNNQSAETYLTLHIKPLLHFNCYSMRLFVEICGYACDDTLSERATRELLKKRERDGGKSSTQ